MTAPGSLPCSAARRVDFPCPRRPPRPWPTPRSFPSTPAIPRARAPPGGCAARVRCPASSTAATASRRTSPSTRGSCATRSPTPARSSTSHRRRQGLAGAGQGPAAPPGARRDRARGLPPREHERDDPDDGRARARRRGRRARRRSRAACSPRRRARSTSRRCRATSRTSITHDVSGMQINDTLTLSAVTVPDGITLLDDLDETVIATITPPTLEPVEDEIETETALVGEDGEAAEGEGDAAEERRRRPTPRTSPEALLLHTGRLADRRARQPRARLRGDAAQRRLQGRGGARSPLGPAASRRRSSTPSSSKGARVRAARGSRCSSRRRS